MYKIQTEGREIKEVIQVGKTVRVDLGLRTNFTKVFELEGYTYEYKFGHELPNGTRVYYVTITGIEEPAKKIPASKKRFVLKNCYELAIDAEQQGENGKYYPTWYIIDKTTDEIVDADWGPGAKTNLKRVADSWNRG